MKGVFLDTETTGLDPFVHVPVEIAFIIVDLCTGTEFATYEALLQVSDEAWMSRDVKSVDIHGLTKKELDIGATRSQVVKEIEALFLDHRITNDQAFFICQNPSFDRPFFSQIIPPYRQESLLWPYHWLDLASMYWAAQGKNLQQNDPFNIRVSKDSIARALGLEAESMPHRAINGARHLLSCYTRLVGFLNG